MGRKALVPYGLYRAHGFFSPYFARQTGFNAADLELLWKALCGMWDQDHSASRGLMALRGLYVFSHDNPLGNAAAHDLFDRVVVARKADIEAPRQFTDYEVFVNEVERADGTREVAPLPEGVHLERLLG
jgi:CRISPR-associated protein Csd2